MYEHDVERPVQQVRSPEGYALIPGIIVARSLAFRGALERLENYARHDRMTLVLEGESGTGKGWLARWAHSLSPRRARPFHYVSLAAVAESLAVSELFGHEVGAFTGARGRRSGAFLSANDGTLFLDEIGKAPLTVQKMLLHVLDSGEIRQLGSDRTIRLNVRLITATSVDLSELLTKGELLPDLYFRLGKFRIAVPPLRKRRADIPDLVRYFVVRNAPFTGYDSVIPRVDVALMQALQTAPWPGNVRELESIVQRLLADAKGDPVLGLGLCTGDLGHLRRRTGRTRGRPLIVSAEEVARAVRCGDSKSAASRKLRVSRSAIYRRLLDERSERSDGAP